MQLGELRTEGPFGDHTGFYTMQDDYPVFHVTCITHRKDPIYAATIVGKPPMEDAWMGKAVERIFLPLMQLTLPEIVDVNLPPEGVFHNLMIVAIKKSYAGHARKVMNGIWAMGQAMGCHQVHHRRRRGLRCPGPRRSHPFAPPTTSTPNATSSSHSAQSTRSTMPAALPNYGSKMGIDATRKWAAEGFTRPWPPMLTMDKEVKTKIDRHLEKIRHRVKPRNLIETMSLF